MCGVAASLHYGDGPSPDRAEILRIRDAMVARGPDDSGLWISPDARVQLAHRRLSILDLSEAGAQPMQNQDGSLVIAFNGEIYNHNELRLTLQHQGYVFRTRTDTEVLLHLYAACGWTMVSKLRGMFAFALWDNRQSGLLLARDTFGIKPLYYSDDGRTFRAASQVKALLAGGSVDTAPEPAGHAGFFLWGHVPCPYTLYRGIRSLSAGSVLWLDRQGTRTERSSNPVQHVYAAAEAAWKGAKGNSRTSRLQQEGGMTSRLHKELLREAIQDSARRHLVADVPVAIFLSAGLDSGILASLAAEQGQGVNTVTLGFEDFRGTAADETVLAERVARQLNANHHTLWMGQRQLEVCLERFLAAMDQPTIDGLNSFLVSWGASWLGFKAALSGVGADELFGGYPGFRQIPLAVDAFKFSAHWPWLGKALRTVSAGWLETIGKGKYAGLLEYGGTWAGAYLLRRALFMPWELPRLLDPDLARQGWNELQNQGDLGQSALQMDSAHLKVACMESTYYLRDRLLRDADWAGMAHGLEIRTPYVDVELVSSLAGLFSENNRPSKGEVARACAPCLPAETFRRRKTGFLVPLKGCLEATRGTSAHRRRRGENRSGLEARSWARFVYAQFPGAKHLANPEELDWNFDDRRSISQ